MPFEFSRQLPPDDLVPFLEFFWLIRWDLEAPFTQVNLPHPSVHVVVEKGKSGVWGVTSGVFERTLEDRGSVIGAKFLPGAFRPMMQASVATITDKVIKLEDFFGVRDALLEATNSGAR